MLRACLLLFLFAVCSAAPSFRWPHPMPRIHGRIIGGVPVDISEYPWQLAVEDLSIHVCGASVISSTYALTAAHCIDDTDEEFVKLSVRAGTSSRESGGTVYEAADFFSHGRYKTWTSGYDIGVIEISGSFSFGENVQAVDLATTEPAVGTKVTTTGWGSESSGGSSPRQLQAVTTTIVSRATCDKHYTRIGWRITETMICAGDTRGGRDACQGDSGGPLVAGNTQYGIVSWGEGCGSATYPGVYSNIADLRDWIKGRTGV